MANILVVDDDESFLYVMERQLSAAGHTVRAFPDWRGVTELLDAGEPAEVLITDIRLPEGTPHGLSLARMAVFRRPELQVIYMTAYDDLVADLHPTLGYIWHKEEDASAIIERLAAIQT